jgi:hypothetical protein
MKVGDLVTKKVTFLDGRVYGIIIAVLDGYTELNIEVHWIGYGTFWDSVGRLELIA